MAAWVGQWPRRWRTRRHACALRTTQALAEAAKAALPEPARASPCFRRRFNRCRRRGRHGIGQCRHPSGVDGLVNNAAILTDDDTDPVTTSLDSWRATLEVNVTGAFLMCKNVLPLFFAKSAAPLSRFLPLWHTARLQHRKSPTRPARARWKP